jgi:AcrR family transcriptional regulator
MVDAARRLIGQKGESFTTQELVKEAGVALQTFYRHFEGKDQLLLAVLEDSIADGALRFEQGAKHLTSPVDRLHHYVTAALKSLHEGAPLGPRFITSEHWRLHQLFPEEMAYATKPVADLIQREIEEATASGLLQSADPERDAWLMTKLVMAAFHHYAFTTDDAGADAVAEDVWAFCLRALGGATEQAEPPRPRPKRRAR